MKADGSNLKKKLNPLLLELMEKKDLDFVLDTFEGVAIKAIRRAMVELKQEDSEEGARNILAKIGTRITFGKEVYSDFLKRKIEEKTTPN